MYHNVHYPVSALAAAPVKSPGVCSVKLFKWEDVLTWPDINPATGMISSSVALKPGKFIYLLESINPSREFSELEKKDAAGPYFEIKQTANLMGSSAAQILTLGTMMHHQWGLILSDKNGYQRLIGNQDSGADLVYDYNSGSGTESRKTPLVFKWEHPQPAPIYAGAAFDIVIGGEILTAGSLQLLIRFQVGASGAPMNDGDTLYINNAIQNKNLLILVDGVGLPIDDFSGDVDWTGSIQRHVEKALASNTINFIGSVNTDEIIEIYAFS